MVRLLLQKGTSTEKKDLIRSTAADYARDAGIENEFFACVEQVKQEKNMLSEQSAPALKVFGLEYFNFLNA